MQYLVRLIVAPASVGIAVYFLLLVVLRVQLPASDRGWAIAAVVGIPFLVTFFSQLHQMDMLYRIERLEAQIGKLLDRGVKP